MLKKKMKRVVIVLCTAALLCGTALAANTIAATEFHDVRMESNDAAGKTTLAFMKADGQTEVVKQTREETKECYFEAIRGTLTYTGAVSGQRYVVLISKSELAENGVKAEDIVFVREVKAESDTITVNFYPAEMANSSQYYVYLTGSSGSTDKGAFRELVATFTYKDYILGDANNDGIIRQDDAMMALQISGKTVPYEDYQYKAADVNRNGIVNPADAMAISQKATNSSFEFPDSAQP